MKNETNSVRKNTIINVSSSIPSSTPQVKSIDYMSLMNNLSESIPGSKRDLTKKHSFIAFSSAENENNSVLKSNSAKPIADHDLRVLQRLKSGELQPELYETYRKSLVIEKKKKNAILQSAIDFTRPRRNTNLTIEPSTTPSTKAERIKLGEVLNSPLNPNHPSDHIKAMEEIRKLKYEVGSQELTSFAERRGREEEEEDCEEANEGEEENEGGEEEDGGEEGDYQQQMKHNNNDEDDGEEDDEDNGLFYKDEEEDDNKVFHDNQHSPQETTKEDNRKELNQQITQPIEESLTESKQFFDVTELPQLNDLSLTSSHQPQHQQYQQPQHHHQRQQQQSRNNQSPNSQQSPPAPYLEQIHVPPPVKYLVDSNTRSLFLDEFGQPLPAKKFIPSPTPNHFMSPLQRSTSPQTTLTRTTTTTSQHPQSQSKSQSSPTKKKSKKHSSNGKKVYVDPQYSTPSRFSTSPSPPRSPPRSPSSAVVQKQLQTQKKNFDFLTELEHSQSQQQQQVQVQVHQQPSNQNSLESFLNETFQKITQSGSSKSKKKTTTSNNHTNNNKSKQKKSSKIPSKFSKEYYEICEERTQPVSQISWKNIKKQERRASKRSSKVYCDSFAEDQFDEEHRPRRFSMEGSEPSTGVSNDELLLRNGVYRDDDLLIINSEVLHEELSDYTLQSFIGLQTPADAIQLQQQQQQLQNQQNNTTNKQSTHKKKIESAYEYLMKDIQPQVESPTGTLHEEQSNQQTTLRIDRENLMNPMEMENLSVTDNTLFSMSMTTTSELLSVEGLTQLPAHNHSNHPHNHSSLQRKDLMNTSISDPLVIIDSTVPSCDLLARCIGKLMYSSHNPNNLQIRPVSAGIGGISAAKIYSPILRTGTGAGAGTRPLSSSGRPKGSSSNTSTTLSSCYHQATKRRHVIQKSIPADYWDVDE